MKNMNSDLSIHNKIIKISLKLMKIDRNEIGKNIQYFLRKKVEKFIFQKFEFFENLKLLKKCQTSTTCIFTNFQAFQMIFLRIAR